jgi:hypothetical protein
MRLAADESPQVCVDHIGMGGHHAVRVARVDLERGVLDQLRLQQGSVFAGDNLIIVALCQ